MDHSYPEPYEQQTLLLFLPWAVETDQQSPDINRLGRIIPGFLADFFRFFSDAEAWFLPEVEIGDEGTAIGWATPGRMPEVEDLEELERDDRTMVIAGSLHRSKNDRIFLTLRVFRGVGEYAALEEVHEVCEDLLELFRTLVDELVPVCSVEYDFERYRAPGTRNPKSFRLYLEGSDVVATHLEGIKVEESHDLFEPLMQALEHDEGFEDAANLLADLVIEYAENPARNVELAARAVNTLLDNGIEYPSIWIARGYCYRALGEMNQAMTSFRKGLAIAETQRHRALCHYEMGHLLVQLGRSDEAIDHLQRAAGFEELEVDALEVWGAALATLERYEEAIDRWSEALILHPDSISALTHLARAHWMMGELDRAESYYRQGMTSPEANGSFCLEVVRFFRALGRISDADEILHDVLDVEPEDITRSCVFRNLGNNALMREDVEEAREFFSKALSEQPSTEEEAWLRRELIPLEHPEWVEEYRGLVDSVFDGDPRIAIQSIRGLLDRAPHFIEAWTLLGTAYRLVRDDQQAYDAYQHANRIFPGTLWALQDLPEVCLRLGRKDEAMRYARESLRIDPDNPELWINMARTELALGDLEAAKAAVDRASALNADTDSLDQIRKDLEQ